MTILLDAMGGDNAPIENIKGAVRAAKEIKSNILLVGNKKIINEKVKEIYGKDSIKELAENIDIHNTTQVIEMDEMPTQAIKEKKDSSMVVGFKLLKEGKGDVLISAGNSGALLTGATLLIGRIKGIDRPAIAPMLPAHKKGFMLIDAGANTNCKPINLLQFAQMANIYIKNIYNIEKPVIGLLNIGTEETKGNDLIKESYNLIKENSEKYNINFVRKCRRKRNIFRKNRCSCYRWIYRKCSIKNSRRTWEVCKKNAYRKLKKEYIYKNRSPVCTTFT
jgi:glycerol-3-phosphate acyltransferase PlsX